MLLHRLPAESNTSTLKTLRIPASPLDKVQRFISACHCWSFFSIETTMQTTRLAQEVNPGPKLSDCTQSVNLLTGAREGKALGPAAPFCFSRRSPPATAAINEDQSSRLRLIALPPETPCCVYLGRLWRSLVGLLAVLACKTPDCLRSYWETMDKAWVCPGPAFV